MPSTDYGLTTILAASTGSATTVSGDVTTGFTTTEYHTGDFWPQPYVPGWYPGYYAAWWPTYPVYVYPPTPVLGCSVEHDYRKLDPARLFCRKCGETKRVK